MGRLHLLPKYQMSTSSQTMRIKVLCLREALRLSHVHILMVMADKRAPQNLLDLVT